MERNQAYELVSNHVDSAIGIGLEDLPDTACLANGLDTLEGFEYGSREADEVAAQVASEYLEEEGMAI